MCVVCVRFQLIYTDATPRKHIMDPEKEVKAFGAPYICFEEGFLVNEYSRASTVSLFLPLYNN